jgi:hypothetical protein
MITKRKIDFFGGLHGNYLELAVNFWIDQNKSYDINLPQFDDIGACHVKNQSATYKPITTAAHYSFGQHKFNSLDLVVRIVPAEQDMLIGITNSFLRAGNQTLDIENLDQNTYEKIKCLSKLEAFLNNLIRDHGLQSEYPRHVLRKYFYAMFDSYEHGLGMFTNWTDVDNYYNFDFRRFFDLSQFYQGLQEIAKFVKLEFVPTERLAELHKEFLKLNQGYASEQKCNKIIQSVIAGDSVEVKLNIIEEAWLNYKISRAFNLYDVEELCQDSYPNNTNIISQICYNYKHLC